MAIFSAELVLHIFEEKYPEDKRPRLAIEAAKKWLVNPSKETAAAAAAAAAAAYAAYAAADAAYAAAAADAANAAAAGKDREREFERQGKFILDFLKSGKHLFLV